MTNSYNNGNLNFRGRGIVKFMNPNSDLARNGFQAKSITGSRQRSGSVKKMQGESFDPDLELFGLA
jgi:hypothetical protein